MEALNASRVINGFISGGGDWTIRKNHAPSASRLIDSSAPCLGPSFRITVPPGLSVEGLQARTFGSESIAASHGAIPESAAAIANTDNFSSISMPRQLPHRHFTSFWFDRHSLWSQARCPLLAHSGRWPGPASDHRQTFLERLLLTQSGHSGSPQTEGSKTTISPVR